MTSSCTFEQCEESIYASGYCRAHYVRWRKYGDPTPRQIQVRYKRRTSLADRLWQQTDQSGGPTSCWCWRGKARMTGGYGQMYNPHLKRPDGTHRIAWIVAIGPIPTGMFVLHTCDNRLCCNPAHLFLGTQADNVADMQRKGRGTYGPFAKLTIAEVREIRQLLAAGAKKTTIAARFDVHRMTIGRIAKGEIWKHVD